MPAPHRNSGTLTGTLGQTRTYSVVLIFFSSNRGKRDNSLRSKSMRYKMLLKGDPSRILLVCPALAALDRSTSASYNVIRHCSGGKTISCPALLAGKKPLGWVQWNSKISLNLSRVSDSESSRLSSERRSVNDSLCAISVPRTAAGLANVTGIQFRHSKYQILPFQALRPPGFGLLLDPCPRATAYNCV